MRLGMVERGSAAARLGDSIGIEHFGRMSREARVCLLPGLAGASNPARNIAGQTLGTRLRRLCRLVLEALGGSPRHRRRGASVLRQVDAPASPAVSPQELAALRRALLGLPRPCRDIYLLHRIEHMNYRQIARHCGISVRTVEARVGRALRLLRQPPAPAGTEATRP